MLKTIRINNAQIVLPASVIKGNVEIQDGRITYIGSGKTFGNPHLVIDAKNKYVLPGFIDIHTNGIAGFDLTNGVYDVHAQGFSSNEEVYLSGLEQALHYYVKTGVTTAILTSLAAPIEQLKKVFAIVKSFKKSEAQNSLKDVIGGLFIEGTFMKGIDFRGAHNPDYFHQPSVELFNELQESGGDNIKIVNVVPEWGDAALRLIEYLTSKNIICAAGHTGATGRQYEMAIEKGLRLAIHFLNGPTGSSSKSFDGGGAVESVLRSDKMFVELIVDGYHVDKAYVLDIIKRKNFENILAITDSMFAAELPGLKEFEVFNIKGKVADNGKYLQIKDRENALFGSSLIMTEAFSNLLTWLTTPIRGIWNPVHEPLNFEDALIRVSMMCSGNPAKVLGIFKSNGSIEVGKIADIIIGDLIQHPDGYTMTIDEVISKGITTVRPIKNYIPR